MRKVTRFATMLSFIFMAACGDSHTDLRSVSGEDEEDYEDIDTGLALASGGETANILAAGADRMKNARITIGGIELSDKLAPTGYYRWDEKSESLTVYVGKGVRGSVRIALPPVNVVDGKFWTFSSFVAAEKGSSYKVEIDDQSRNSNGEAIGREPLTTETLMPTGSRRFVNVNLGKETKPVTRQKMIIEVTALKPTAKKYQYFTFTKPRMLLKKNFLRPRQFVNYINIATLTTLSKRQKEQIQELYDAGHRTWVLGPRSAEEAQAAVKVIDSIPALRASKFILGGGRLGKPNNCDIEYYTVRSENGINTTLNYKPKHVVIAGDKDIPEDKKEGLTSVMANCAKGERRDQKLAVMDKKLADYIKNAEILGKYMAGFYVFDEASSHGFTSQFNNYLYYRLRELMPEMPIVITQNGRIAGSRLAWQYPVDIQRKYFANDNADIFFFDHYNRVGLHEGRTNEQKDFLKFMLDSEMLTKKPFVRLLGTGIDPGLCTVRKDFLRYYNISIRLTEDLGGAVRSQMNYGFWGFQNAEAEKNHDYSKWLSTLAHQKKHYCPAQFDAVVDWSAKIFSGK